MRKKGRQKEKKERGKEARERKLTIPSSFFSDVNFIATTQRFTDKFVPAPDSECRLSGLLRPDEATSRYDRIRDDEGKVSVVDYPPLFLFTCTSFSFALTLTSLLLPPSHFTSSLFSTILCTVDVFLDHSSPIISPSVMRTRGPAIPFLRFSHFNATSVRLRDDTYYTPRPHDNIVDNGDDGCTSLFMLPLAQPTPAYLLLVCRSAAARSNFPTPSFSRSYFRDVRRMLAQTFSDLRQPMRV